VGHISTATDRSHGGEDKIPIPQGDGNHLFDSPCTSRKTRWPCRGFDRAPDQRHPPRWRFDLSPLQIRVAANRSPASRGKGCNSPKGSRGSPLVGGSERSVYRAYPKYRLVADKAKEQLLSSGVAYITAADEPRCPNHQPTVEHPAPGREDVSFAPLRHPPNIAALEQIASRSPSAWLTVLFFTKVDCWPTTGSCASDFWLDRIAGATKPKDRALVFPSESVRERASTSASE